MIGSQSSPRATDINGDGTDDLIMGACRNEYIPTEKGILALDGKTGAMLWQSPAEDQVFGTATLLDINGDDVKDAIVGGRWSFLRAVDGTSGKTIWDYSYTDSIDPVKKYVKYNFYNSVLVPDQNGDGLMDFIIQNGGNHKAAPNDSLTRFPGVLLLMDSRSGAILAADTMPDGRECYNSPLFIKQPDGNEFILFGSGGETFGGHLYCCKLVDLKNNDLKLSKILVTDFNGHGFIGPPVVFDINKDGYLDVVSISHSSLITATDGKTWTTIWSKKIDNTECSNSFAVGHFNGDQIPDVFTFVSKGIWPQSTGSVQLALNGKDGSILYKDSIGCAGFSSPVAYDLNHDGMDEVIMSVNEYDCAQGYTSSSVKNIRNKMLIIDFKTKQIQEMESAPQFKNIYSTPFLSDLDHNGYLDLVYAQFYSPGYDLLQFLGMRIKRVETGVKIHRQIQWGAYMGTNGDGIYR